MRKKPYIIAVLIPIAVAVYFVISAKEETKLAPPVNMTSLPNLKQLAKPTSGINPPHGQPGHRCDISAGAPLPTSGKPSVSPQPSFSPVKSAAVQAPVSGSSPISTVKSPAPKVNPPHGQPGHRCDVKTGDPLPPPGTPSPQQAVSPKPNATTIVPAVSAGSKLNPAHGEPGHRCDIQAGAPLPAS